MAGLPPGVNLSEIPAATPPPGVTSNLAHPSPTLEAVVIGVTVTFLLIGLTLAIGSTIHRVRSGVYASDYLLFSSVILTIAYSIIVMLNSDVAVHQWDISVAKISSPRVQKLNFAQDELTCFSIFLAKAAILTLYLQLFSPSVRFTYAVYFGYLLDFLAYTPQVIAAPLLCAPRAGHPWGLTLGSKCDHDIPVGIARSVMGTILDIYLFILPIPIIAKLNMSRRKKIGILLIFGTAFLGIVSSVCSLAYVIIEYKTEDKQWYAAVIELCNIIETWTAIIVASVPGCASAFKRSLLQTGVLSNWLISLRSLLSRSRSRSQTQPRTAGSDRDSDLDGWANDEQALNENSPYYWRAASRHNQNKSTGTSTEADHQINDSKQLELEEITVPAR